MATERRPRVEDLTQRQRDVLDLVAAGKTNAEIAETLGISLDGAKWHMREILGRLGVESREEAAAWWRASRFRGRRDLTKRAMTIAAGLSLILGAGAAASVALLRDSEGRGPDGTGVQASDVAVGEPLPDCELGEVAFDPTVALHRSDGTVVLGMATTREPGCMLRPGWVVVIQREGDRTIGTYLLHGTQDIAPGVPGVANGPIQRLKPIATLLNGCGEDDVVVGLQGPPGTNRLVFAPAPLPGCLDKTRPVQARSAASWPRGEVGPVTRCRPGDYGVRSSASRTSGRAQLSVSIEASTMLPCRVDGTARVVLSRPGEPASFASIEAELSVMIPQDGAGAVFSWPQSCGLGGLYEARVSIAGRDFPPLSLDLPEAGCSAEPVEIQAYIYG